MSRRVILASAVSVAAAGLGGTGAQASALPANDARLLELHARMPGLLDAQDAAYTVLSRAEGDVEEAAATPACDAADDAKEACVRALAAIPAVSLVGLAIKAFWTTRALEEGWVESCGLPESLRTDLARLVPGVVAW